MVGAAGFEPETLHPQLGAEGKWYLSYPVSATGGKLTNAKPAQPDSTQIVHE